MIYLDYNATTPVDAAVLQEMLPYFSEKFGNAASATHLYGTTARQAVELARTRITGSIGCSEQELIFTSGATESINLALKGVFHLYASKGKHIVTVETEHKAVLDTCAFLEKEGAELSILNVGRNGLIDLDELESAIREDTILVAIMYANNETGVLQPVREIAKLVHQKRSIFFCDATQAMGKVPVNVQDDGIDLMSLSAHKIYGPKGCGALFVRRRDPRVSLEPLLHGGGHERGLRSGTLNVPGIVGMGKACMLINSDPAQIRAMRDRLEDGVREIFGDKALINGIESPRLPNTSNICFPFKAVDFIHANKEALAVATGSACTSAENHPSHVLTAMGLTKQQAECSIRFSLGKYTSPDEIDEVLKMLRNMPA